MLIMNYYITKYFFILRKYKIRSYSKTTIDEVEIEHSKNDYCAQFHIHLIIVFGVNFNVIGALSKKYFVTLYNTVKNYWC